MTLHPDGANPTVVPVGVLQDVNLDMGIELKRLHGNRTFPVKVARGKGTITGKAKTGIFQGGLISALLAGSTKTDGASVGMKEHTADVPGTPYTITVTDGGDWRYDLGVFDNDTGLYMTRVATGATPATGQFKLDESTGAYTFAAADTGHSITITYASDDASGSTVTYKNQLMGKQTKFGLTLFSNFDDLGFGIHLYGVVLGKMTFPFKNDDFAVPDIDFEGFADNSGNVIDLYLAESA